MSRERLRELLERWFDGTLDRAGHLELEEAARRDAEAASAVRRQERLVRALHGLEDPRRDSFDVERFVAAVKARVEERPARPALRRVAPHLLVAAASIAALVGLWFATRSPTKLPRLVEPKVADVGTPVAPVVGAEFKHEEVQTGAAAGPGRSGPAFEVAAVAPAADRNRLAAALRATGEVLGRSELLGNYTASEARAWCDAVRRAIERAVEGGWPVDALVERRATATASADELASVAAFLLVSDEPTGRRRALRVLSADTRAPLAESGALEASAVRGAWRRAVLAVGGSDLVVELVAVGAFEASDAPAVLERFVADRTLAARLLRRTLDDVDAGLLAALARFDESLVEPLVELALEGREADHVLAALRDVPSARVAVATRLTAARSSRERRSALRLVGAIGAVEALADVRRACADGEVVAFEALRLLPGREALVAWIELAPQFAPARRTAAWYAVTQNRGLELADFIANADAGDERLIGLVDALVATGSPRACVALLELAARVELPPSERAQCVDAALALGVVRELGSTAVAAALTRIADGAPSDVRVQEACLVLLYTAAGHERAKTWCVERYGDDGPCVVLGEDFDAGAPRATAVRARLRLFLDKTLKTRSRA